jgi:GMP synthase-like glutamine amidotransferase
MKIHCLQHVPFETPARIATWADQNGHDLTTCHVYQEPIGIPEDSDWVIAMGGPMSVHEESEYPWLLAEKRAIEWAMESGKTVIGICLGAQIIAQVMGADVRPNDHLEIGWYPVQLTDAGRVHPVSHDLPHQFDAFHWHGELFDVPTGAVGLGATDVTPAQMFAVENCIVGLQFHLEMDDTGIAALIEHCERDLVPGPHTQGRAAMLNQNIRLQSAHKTLDSILSHL